MPLTVRHMDGQFEGRTQTFDDDVESILIGRDPSTCQIVLPPDARMASREHCTLARVRGRYLIDMNADRRVTLDGHQMLERGSPLPDSCELQIGPDGPRLKLLVIRHSQMESTADQQIDESEVVRRSSRAATEMDVEEVAQEAGSSRRLGVIAGVIAVLAVAVGLVVFFVTRSDVEDLQVADAQQDQAIGSLEGRTDEIEDDLIVLGADLPEIMDSARESVYLVVYRAADGGETGVGTAFAVGPTTVATNAHVAAWHDRLEVGDQLVLRSAAEDGEDPEDIAIISAAAHPGYDAFAELWRDYVPVRLNASKGIDPVRSAGSACDVALLSVAEGASLGPPLPMASEVHQASLAPGHAIASVGFPMEGMAMEGVNVRRPVPQSQIGRVTALTTFFNTSEDESETGPGQRNTLVQHSIPGTGGASGSPIINGAGEVVGVLSAVNFAIVDGQRFPTGVGVNFAQRSTLLEELMEGAALGALQDRLALWNASVQQLYHSGKLIRGKGDMDALIALWRRQIQDQAGDDVVVLTKERAREFFPLTSLEAGRQGGDGDSDGFTTEVPIDIEADGWYLFVVESDGQVVADLDDPDGAATGKVYVPLAEGVHGVAFRGKTDGQVVGTIQTDGQQHVTYGIQEGESVTAMPANILKLARDQWRDDLNDRWGTKVRDAGGLAGQGDTVTETADGRFYEVQPISIDRYGRYMIAVVAPDRQNVDLRLFRVDGDQRDLIAEDVQDDWYPYLVIDTDLGVELEAEIVSDEANADYEVYVYRAVVAGDTDDDDTVQATDIVNVALNFGNEAPEGEVLAADVDDSGKVDVQDLLDVLSNFNEGWPIDGQPQPKRLICMFTIGGSYHQGLAGIHPLLFNEQDGWNLIVESRVKPLANRLGVGAFDWWGHNVCGYWSDHDYYWASDEITEVMTFEQLMYAREQIPSLTDFSPLREFADTQGMQLYGYIGQPRSYERSGTPGGMPFDTDWSHGDKTKMDLYYKEFIDSRFIGLGHDASIHHPAGSPWLTEMVPALKENGIEVFIESLPKRSHPHLLGMNVVAEHRVWTNFGNYPEVWYTEDEIKAAGGRTIHMITWPFGQAPGDSGYDPDFDNSQWQFQKAKELLLAGEFVVCPLYGLHNRGYPLEELVEAAAPRAKVIVE
ncbi:MAG: trypsin-like peptidase domain-containing protein [Phycisphaerales bacterium]|nr:trypsin-like peptidase domain-containing protein [Phycisphaerales bacterium]